jgi:hypothetical protein
LTTTDPVALLIPRRHVETWICSLIGRTVTEEDDCKDWDRPTRDEIRQAANTTYEWARDNAAGANLRPVATDRSSRVAKDCVSQDRVSYIASKRNPVT